MEEKEIKEKIYLYDNNYDFYRRMYLQTANGEYKYQMDRWYNLKKEQEELLKTLTK